MQESVHSDLLRFVYREMTALEAVDFSEILHESPELTNEFFSTVEAKSALPKVQFEPSSASIDRILAYSKSTAFETHF